ncbi:MAG: FtsH protease activity modulator HflK [Clostridiales bacterium]|jgi:membrane protease subunit HflK|nr:FtsH protease activity modulator HflK [Clostridiales bacterium]
MGESFSAKQAVRVLAVTLAGLLVVAAAFASVYTVTEQQQAVVTQFGKVIDIKGAGLHFIVPLIQAQRLVDMTTKGMMIGYSSEQSTNSAYTVPTESLMITRDFNFVNVDFYVEWRVTDPAKYLFNSSQPEIILRNALQSEARAAVSSYDVDAVLTTAKSEIQAKIKEGAQEKLDEYNLGLVVSNVSIQDTEPPTPEVVAAFKDVENAKQSKDTEINTARTYYNEEIPSARAEADRILKAAESERESRINEAKGQVARFNEMFSEYAKNKEITRTRMYLEAMEEILPGIKVYIDSGAGDTMKLLPLEPLEGGAQE